MSVSEAARAARRAEIERALARYPHLTAEGLAELTDYFERDASALDVGLIASNPAIADRYREFRATHVDEARFATSALDARNARSRAPERKLSAPWRRWSIAGDSNARFEAQGLNLRARV